MEHKRLLRAMVPAVCSRAEARKTNPKLQAVAARCILIFLGMAAASFSAETPKPLPGSELCVACHDEGRQVGKRQEGVPPAIDAAALRASPHAALECTACHSDVDPKSLPHAEKLAPVDCGTCHGDEGSQYAESLHGRASKRGDSLEIGRAHV